MECCNVDLWNTEFKAKKWKTQVLTTWLIVEVWPTNLGKSCILSQEAFAKQSGWFISCTLEPPWMACKEIHSIGPFLKPVKPYITQKTRAFQVGYKTGQYQLSDEHSTTILAIPPRKGRLLFPTQNNTLWGGGAYASKLPYFCIVWPLQNGWFKDLKSKGTKKLHIPLTSLQLNHGGTKVTSGPVLWRTGPRGSGDLGRTQLKLPRPPLLTNELGQKSLKMKVWYMIFPLQGLLFRFPQCC